MIVLTIGGTTSYWWYCHSLATVRAPVAAGSAVPKFVTAFAWSVSCLALILIAASREAAPSNTPSSVDPAYPSSSSSKSWRNPPRHPPAVGRVPTFTDVRILGSSHHSFLNPLSIVEGTTPRVVVNPGESSTVWGVIFTFILTIALGIHIRPAVVVLAEISIALNQLTLNCRMWNLTMYLHHLNYQGN